MAQLIQITDLHLVKSDGLLLLEHDMRAASLKDARLSA